MSSIVGGFRVGCAEGCEGMCRGVCRDVQRNNKFRSYASALGSISVYGFMIFSTLSVFIDF